MPDRPTFELGLVMAGAVSARAYTAGVLDFLIEALDAIEDVRAGRDTGYLRSDEPDAKPILAPPHQLRLTAMSGTSAGAMVTGIFTTVLGTRVPPVGPDRQLDERSPAKNPLYDAWVQLIIVAFGVAQCVGNNLFQVTGVEQRPNRRAARNIVGREQLVLIDQRAYVGPKLPIYLCIGNLRGVRYSLSLSVDKGVVNEHQMSMHADWMGFCFDRDPAASLPGMRSLAPGRAFDHWQTLGAGALASGAFPVGLSARELRRNFTDYEERDWYEPAMPRDPKRRIARDSRYIGQAWMPSSWISQSGGKTELPPLGHAGDFPPDGEYRFVNVDGGVFNNEPLELCRAAVAGDRPRNPRDPQQADRAVLLIDPFPNLFELDHHYDPTTQSHILQVVRSLLGAFVSQARFKPDELALAKDPTSRAATPLCQSATTRMTSRRNTRSPAARWAGSAAFYQRRSGITTSCWAGATVSVSSPDISCCRPTPGRARSIRYSRLGPTRRHAAASKSRRPGGSGRPIQFICPLCRCSGNWPARAIPGYPTGPPTPRTCRSPICGKAFSTGRMR